MSLSKSVVAPGSALFICTIIVATTGQSRFGNEIKLNNLPTTNMSNPGAVVSQLTNQEDNLSGKWVVKESEGERKTRVQQIDRVTNSLSVFVRGKAKKRLRTATTPSRNVEIINHGDQVRLRTSQGQVTAKTDGSTTRVKTAQGEGDISARWDKDKLIVNMRASNGKRTTVYQPSKDGRSMTVHVQLENQSLPEPMRYRVTYVRE